MLPPSERTGEYNVLPCKALPYTTTPNLPLPYNTLLMPTATTGAAKRKKASGGSGRFARDLHFPDLSLPEPIYDLKETLPINRDPRSPYTGTVTIRNDPSIFTAQARMRDEIEARHGRPGIWDDTDPEIATEPRLCAVETWCIGLAVGDM